jgi:AraC family transcriptional regulator, regulatory protein of adaptative response / methylphosphotriester-DNA alkyltransferase methyltransferase
MNTTIQSPDKKTSAGIPKKIFQRQHEITADFLREVDNHLNDILQGKTTRMFEIKDIAEIMHIHPTHLSNTIKLTTGQSPCFFFEEKIMAIAKKMLGETRIPIADIATSLTFDPSNFTKFFKRFAGSTPKQYREQVINDLKN